MLRSLVRVIGICSLAIGFLIFSASNPIGGRVLSASSIEVFQLVFSGLPNPSISITDPDDIEVLVSLLDDIPRASPPSWADSAFGGFLLVNLAVDFRLPPVARVFQGTIEIQGLVDEDGNQIYYQDVYGLEAFLEDQFSTLTLTQQGTPLGSTSNENSPSNTSRLFSSSQRQLPLSGSEPPFEPERWNINIRKFIGVCVRLGGVLCYGALWELIELIGELRDLLDSVIAQTRNNCYNYACNRRTDTFAQPGRAGGKGDPTWADLTCDKMKERAKADGLTEVKCNKACPAGSYKKMLFVDAVDDPNQPGDDRDYHWYRQDNTGNWSHKPGRTQATDRDDSGNPITDPRNADTDTRRDLDGDGKPDVGLDYKFCGCFCCGPNVKKK